MSTVEIENENRGKNGKNKNTNEAVQDGETAKSVVRWQSGNSFFENRTQREWLSTEEAAHFLSVSPNALRIMVHRGQIEAYRLGRRLRFSVRDCQALFRKKGA